ncbi:hypothetical protein B1219_05125 [Pseudomonas ogarae]|uniref:hypothetical protein n=1 Tax=Pseudomonas ogarae (strain DSM 112162 / CECT 30235 / F113) TaxID=1114970 RepID=UPI0009A339DA|nr:hypothetical protein [Pseudomonas ogarae]OPG74445.1 hypothetical protein B1219_05125 [Pseudomonas ogarae]OPG78370.1 hypothetical protein B1218_15970 [Pseudomonas ogarae]
MDLFLKTTPARRPNVNTAWRKRLATAFTASALVASASASTASATSSAACTNEADFQAGTVVEYESRDNLSSAISRGKTEALGREAFADANPVASAHTSFLNNVPFFLTTTFAEIKDDRLIRYGDRHGAGASLVTTTYQPPASTPIDLQPGQTVTVSYTTKAVSAGATIEFDVVEKLTYNGRETIKTALGTFDTCKFTNEISTGSVSATQPKNVVVVQNWFPAEGPYRGQSIRSVTPPANGVAQRITEVVKMQYEAR